MSSRFQFIEDHRDAFGVKRLCRMLQLSRSGFYRWLDGAHARSERSRADAELAERITGITPSPTAPTAPRASPPNCDSIGLRVSLAAVSGS